VSIEVDTPVGPARVHLTRPDASGWLTSRGLLLLGHSAGGGIEAPDLRALAVALPAAGFSVGLVEQPYRVAGRRGPAPARALDEAMLAVVAAVRVNSEPLVLGGRSSGARVACRTAALLSLERPAERPGASGAAGVLALAFPLRPPWRPDSTRLPELEATGVPVLAVQGERDHFGSAADLAAVAPEHVRVLMVPGADHSLRRPLDLGEITRWMLERVSGP
jgi:predicted alpha/beta-hydrolase family hydrolase